MKELELADTERMIQEAEATLKNSKEKFAADREAWEKRKAAELKKAQDGQGKPQ